MFTSFFVGHGCYDNSWGHLGKSPNREQEYLQLRKPDLKVNHLQHMPRTSGWLLGHQSAATAPTVLLVMHERAGMSLLNRHEVREGDAN